MRQTAFWILLSAFAVCLTACAGAGETAVAVGAGLAGAIAVVDQLLVGGTVTAEQAAALKGGFTELQQALIAAQQAAAGKADPALVASGTTAAILAALRAWASFQNLRAKAKASAAA